MLGYRLTAWGSRLEMQKIRVDMKIRGSFLGVPKMKTIVFWGLYWGPLILGKYHM